VSDVREDALPAQTVLIAQAQTELGQVPAVLPQLYDRIFGALHDQGLRAAGHEQAYYEYGEEGLTVIAAVPAPDGFQPTEDVALFERPAEKTLCVTVMGPYQRIPAAYQALFNAAEERELGVISSREIYFGWTPYPQERRTDVHIGIESA
jgi:effector-binding domain-containing protein